MKTWGRTSADEHLRTMDSSFARLPAMSGSYTTSAPRQTTGICFNSKSEKADCQQLHKIQNRLRCVNVCPRHLQKSDLRRWWHQLRSPSALPLRLPSSPASPRWPLGSSARSAHSARRCLWVSAALWSDSRWRWIASGCTTDRRRYPSTPHRCPAPAPSWRRRSKSKSCRSSTWRATTCRSFRLPACKDLLILQSPLCQVKSRLPRHQPGGPLWDQSNVLHQAHSATSRLQDTNIAALQIKTPASNSWQK